MKRFLLIKLALFFSISLLLLFSNRGEAIAEQKGDDAVCFRWAFDTFWSTSDDLGTGFLLQNFLPNRTSITARSPITAIFDNFRINAAEEIIENEI